MDIIVKLDDIWLSEDLLSYLENETNYDKLLETFKEKAFFNVIIYGLDLFLDGEDVKTKYKDEISRLPEVEQQPMLKDYIHEVTVGNRIKQKNISPQTCYIWMVRVNDYAYFSDSYNNIVKYFSSYRSFPEFLVNEQTPTKTGQIVLKELDKLLNELFTKEVSTEITVY